LPIIGFQCITLLFTELHKDEKNCLSELPTFYKMAVIDVDFVLIHFALDNFCKRREPILLLSSYSEMLVVSEPD